MDSFTIERSQFVSGLHWQILSDKPSEVKAEIRLKAQMLTYDLHVYRKTGVPQVGFAGTNEGYRAGMVSAAAIVSKTVELEFNERDFLCATALPDGRFLYVAQSEGVILTTGDLISDEETVKSRLLEARSLDKTWEFIVAPASWGIENSHERDFISFLPAKNGKVDLKHTWWCLSPVETSLKEYLKRYAKPLSAIGVVAIGGAVAQQWLAFNAAQEAERVAAELRAAAQAAPQTINPWKLKPRSVPLAKACDDLFNQQSTYWPGNWVPVTAACSLKTNALVTTWNRGEMGFVTHLREIVPDVVIAIDKSSATRISPLPALPTGDDEPLDVEARVAERLNGISQSLGVTLTLTAANAAPALPGAWQAVPSGSREIAVTLNTGGLASLPVIEALDGPGFPVNTITAKFNGGQITWEVGGSQYVK